MALARGDRAALFVRNLELAMVDAAIRAGPPP